MKTCNDNNPLSDAALLVKAKQIIRETNIEAEPSNCSLTMGGACPLLKSMLDSFRDKPKS